MPPVPGCLSVFPVDISFQSTKLCIDDLRLRWKEMQVLEALVEVVSDLQAFRDVGSVIALSQGEDIENRPRCLCANVGVSGEQTNRLLLSPQ
jgi:hypothetical protein